MKIHDTVLYWNLLIAISVLGFLGKELDPILDLGDTTINSVAGALATVTNHSHLRESEYIT